MSEQTLDLIGTRCPIPEAKSREKLEQLKKGDIVRILADDKRSCESIPMVVKGSNSKIIEFNRKEQEGKEVFY